MIRALTAEDADRDIKTLSPKEDEHAGSIGHQCRRTIKRNEASSIRDCKAVPVIHALKGQTNNSRRFQPTGNEC